MSTDAEPAEPALAELVELVERLDADNERLRLKALELMELMEAAVTEQVAGERRIDELERQVAALQTEVDALHGTRLMRLARPVRAAYGRMRNRGGNRRG